MPHGTGTGLEGGTTAVRGGVAVDLVKNMDNVREVLLWIKIEEVLGNERIVWLF